MTNISMTDISMTNIVTISSKELLDLRRDPLLGILVGFLSFAVVISVVIGAADFKVQLDAYTLYVHQLASAGSSVVPAAPQLFPLQLLRGGMEYIEILGALFAVVLGYGTIAKAKYRNQVKNQPAEMALPPA